MNKPPTPNKTKISTMNDVVMTPFITAKFIVDYYNPKGSILEPCAGLKEILFLGGGRKHKLPFGFPVGCLYYKRDYKGDCKISHKFDLY